MNRSAMRHIFALSIGTLLTCAAGVVLAQNPHLQEELDVDVNNQGDLVVEFDAAGLGGGNDEVTVTVTADAAATYVCLTRSNRCPQAANKTTVSTQVGATETVPVRNGRASGTVTVDVPSPGAFACPSGQHAELSSVTYRNIVFSIEGEILATPGNETETFFTCP